MSCDINGITVDVVRGDICDRPVDAIVNAANNHFWMGGGVAGAIKRRGGEEIEREAMRQGPAPVGSVAVTGAGALPAAYVIHAAVMGQDLSTSAVYIRRATEGALEKANELHLRSIAFPALGTGVGGFPLRACAEIMLSAVAAHTASETSLTRVEFVLFDEAAYAIFNQTLLTYEVGADG